MTERRDAVPTIGAVGVPPGETNSDQSRRVPVVSIGIALAALLAFAFGTQPSELTTSTAPQALPPTSSTSTTATSAAPEPVRPAFDRAPFDVFLPAWAVSNGESSWVFSAARPASGALRGTGLVAHSTDGSEWVEHGIVIEEAVEVFNVEHTGGWFTASAVTRTEPLGQVVYISEDGVQWSRLQPPAGRASFATGGLTGLLVVTYPVFDDVPYRRALDALPDEIRPDVQSGRLAWWFDGGPGGSEVVVGIGSLELGRFPLSEPESPEPTGDESPGEPPTIWLVRDGGTTWTPQKATGGGFWPHQAITLDDGTFVLGGWTGERNLLLAFDGTSWTEIEGIASLGLATEWKGWFLALRGAQVMASRDLANWDVVLQIEPVRQSLSHLYSGLNYLVATHTTDLVLSAIEPTASLFFDDVQVVFDYASLTVLQNGQTLVRHALSGRQAGLATLDDDNVVVFGPDGLPVVEIPLDEVAAVWRHINDHYRPEMAALIASTVDTWAPIELPFSLSPDTGTVAAGEHHLVMIERSKDTATASIWIGRMES